jgi:hypothetical protein
MGRPVRDSRLGVLLPERLWLTPGTLFAWRPAHRQEQVDLPECRGTSAGAPRAAAPAPAGHIPALRPAGRIFPVAVTAGRSLSTRRPSAASTSSSADDALGTAGLDARLAVMGRAGGGDAGTVSLSAAPHGLDEAAPPARPGTSMTSTPAASRPPMSGHSSAETGDGEPVASGRPQVIRHVPGDLPRDPRSGRRRGADRVGSSCVPGGFRALPGQDVRPFG